MTTTSAWTRCAAGDQIARDALVRENLGLVHHVARRLARRLHDAAELDELVSVGTMGLLHAMESFDPARGLSFSTFAVPRIRGAILDELRRQDRVPRSVRRKSRELAAAREALAGALGRAPSESEVAERLGVPVETLHRWELDIESGVRVSLDRPTRWTSGGEDRARAVAELLAVDDHASLDDRLSREQEVALLREALGTLREQERAVLALNYYEELKLHEIAQVMGLSASRISQIRSEALAKLRERLAGLRAA